MNYNTTAGRTNAPTKANDLDQIEITIIPIDGKPYSQVIDIPN